MRSLLRRQQAPVAAIDAPGFHGKVPSLGDFVSRRLPPGFTAPWDAWLQGLVRASRERLGPDWLAAWLEAPVWHFTLAAGVAGPECCLGVLIPSVDRVGRHFPFTILGLAVPGGAPLPLWTGRAETLALSALDEAFDPDSLEAELSALGAPAHEALAMPAPGETLWRCRGSSRVPATVLRCQGLPDDDEVAGLVAG